MHASQVIDMQVDLVDRFQSADFRAVLSGSLDKERSGISGDIVNMLENHVRGAYAYRVAGDMTSLVIHAANSLDADDRVETSLPPTGCGLVRFDRPLAMTDVRGKVMKAHWLTWGPTVVNEETAFGSRQVAAIAISVWNDGDEPDDIANDLFETFGRKKVSQMVGRWHYVGVKIMREGSSLGPSEVTLDDTYAEQVAAEGDSPTAYTNFSRHVHALWLLLNQTITTVEEEHVRSTSQKAARRKNLPARVSVIDLRRSENYHRSEGESHVEWSRRWVVRGHWRWQAYGAGRAERRRIWIAPFVKGPEGAPFTVPDKVYSLRR